MADLIQIRRDTAANWTSADPILAQGELGVETDTSNIKIGDGTTAWSSLTYLIYDGYDVKGTTISATGSPAVFDIDMNVANFFEATATESSEFTFTGSFTSGDLYGFVLALTNGGAFTITWPTSVDWASDGAPTLTTSGLDILVFITYDAGTTWHGIVSSKDSK